MYPWAPQVSIDNGLRSIIYLGSGPFDAGVARLIAWGCVGLAALAVGVFIPSHKKTA
ncbi:hypothetical protein [Slackia heliotrinireducens]|uniref:hypothetical protein n=1 Tax=Slackia heliotrinireducens TaxID=84110 RepID=UPI0033145DFC